MGNNFVKSRRDFIKKIACTGAGMTALPSSFLGMQSMYSLLQSNNLMNDCQDYKALVCVYMFGGNDGFNTLIPKGTAEYAEYAKSRGNLAIPQSEILSISPLINASGRTLGLHPNMSGVQKLFNDSKLSFISNIGTLTKPNTSQFDYQQHKIPSQLFSHYDQTLQWQTGTSISKSRLGWAGNISDLLMDCNTNKNIPLNVSLGGNNTFQTGKDTSFFSASSRGINLLRGIGYHNQNGLVGSKTEAVRSLFNHTYDDVLCDTYTTKFNNGIESNQILYEKLRDLELAGGLQSQFSIAESGFSLSADLKLVSEMISLRNVLGMKRQIFFVNVPAFDQHDNLLIDHGRRMEIIDKGLSEFYPALKELGVEDKVITFTMSDFGRTLTSNGDGSDHGWGSNVMVMGDAIQGQNIYGNYPSLALGNPLDIGRGAIIPTTSSVSYFAELASWFGIPRGDLNTIFPELSSFWDSSSPQFPIQFIK